MRTRVPLNVGLPAPGAARRARLTRMTKTMSFGYDGDGGLGDRLLAAVLSGEKTATSSLAIAYLSG